MADPTDINPLSKADLAKLGKASYALTAAQQMIDRAEQAGLDLSEENMRCGALRKRIENLIQVYSQTK